MAICSDGNVGAYFFYDRFHDSVGALIPDEASGYFSDKFPTAGQITPLTVRNLWSGACYCGVGGANYFTPMGCHQNYAAARKTFCENLKDAGGNIVTNPPAICGGTGPEILNYNPISAAIQDVQTQANDLSAQYDASNNVKTILKAGAIIFLAIILIQTIRKA